MMKNQRQVKYNSQSYMGEKQELGKILAVTGASGKKSGGFFAEVLSDNRQKVMKEFPGGVRVVLRKTSDSSELDKLSMHFEEHRGDMDDGDFLAEAFKDVDTIVHIAGISISNGIVDAAVKCRVRRMILVHTTGIYSKYKEAGEEYRKIDAYAEMQCNENDIVLTILRPTMIYGNITDRNVVTFIKMVDKFPIMPIVNGARYALQPVHYKDLGYAYYQVLMNEDATANCNFDLSGGESIDLREMLVLIGENLGKKVHFLSVPYFLAYAGACVIYVVSLMKVDYREKVQRLCEPRVYSHQEATLAFGYTPRTFQEGIVDEVREYKEANKK